MENTDGLFHPGLAEAFKKLDPEDGEQIVEYLRTHALLMKEKALLQASVRDQRKLLVENGKLKKDIEQLKGQLQEKQRRRTAKVLLAPPPPVTSPAPDPPVNQTPSLIGATAAVPGNSVPPSSTANGRRRGGRRARPSADSLSLGAEPRVDVSRLDLRVGRVLSVRHHPVAEGLTVQEVEVGEEAPRTVVCRLEGLQGSLVVLLCNVKACKLRGVVSQARLLCCSAPDDHEEPLTPPPGSAPGDRISCHDYPGEPDRQLQAQQRLWERIQPELQVDLRGVASFRGCCFQVKGKGVCRAPTLTCCSIR